MDYFIERNMHFHRVPPCGVHVRVYVHVRVHVHVCVCECVTYDAPQPHYLIMVLSSPCTVHFYFLLLFRPYHPSTSRVKHKGTQIFFHFVKNGRLWIHG